MGRAETERHRDIANIPDEYLYEKLGLYILPRKARQLARAKA